MATSPGQRFVRRQQAARSSTTNGTAADIGYDTAVISEGGYSWSSPEVTVDEAGYYLNLFDLGLCDLGSTRAVGTLVPSINTTNQLTFRATHRYLRNSGGNDGCSFGAAIHDLSVNDSLKIRNPGAITPTDAVNSYACAAGEGGGFQVIRLPDGDFTDVRRTTDAAEVGTSNINTTRPWLDGSGTWTKVTYNSEVSDDGAYYSGSGGDVVLPANKKFLIVWGMTCYSTDASRHTYVSRLQIDGTNVQRASGYQRNTASQGPPMVGIYLHETGGSSETANLWATHEIEGGDAGTPNVADAYMQVLELPSSAEWIHVDNGAADSLTTALAGTTTWYDTPLSSTVRADGDSDLSLDGSNNAVQNDSGASLPVLLIGWQSWDRDSGASGTRKAPMLRANNGGSAVQYGNNSAFSRGQQSNDDTFQAHVVMAATFDLANGADAKLQVTDRHSGSNSDMGVYASTSRYFLGVQALKLGSLDAGGTDALLADDVEADAEVGAPAIGQEHALTSTDVESAAEVTSPAIGQEHALLADDSESQSEITSPALSETHVLTATSVESAAEVTAPNLSENAGTNALSADDIESQAELDTPALGQVHGLLADNVESQAETWTPAIGQTHVLQANHVESQAETGAPALGQVHALLADDVEAFAELNAPQAATADHVLFADSVESQVEISVPVMNVYGGSADRQMFCSTFRGTFR